MNVLVDTSVWVAHFRQHNAQLAGMIERDWVLVHPIVLGEIFCGTPPAPRTQTLSDLRLLRQAQVASLDEVIEFVERESLYGLGCGLADLSLLASSLLSPDTTLWTRDRRLAEIATRFDVMCTPALH